MATRLPKSTLVALSLTVAVTAMALGGSAYAQTGTPQHHGLSICAGLCQIKVAGGTSTGGSLRNAPASDFTDQAASDDDSAEPATDAASASSADDPQAEADEGETGIRRSRATYDSDLAEPE